MKLSYAQEDKLISFFPSLELSYIKNIHKKVLSDLYLIIPKGQKYFAWFKCWNNKNLCFIMKVDYRSKQISSIKVYPSIFDHTLCSDKGTILYGTIFHNKCNIFCIEDIFYYKSKNVNFLNFSNKLKYLDLMFSKDLSQCAYNKNDMVFSLPIMNRNFNTLLNIAQNQISYDIYCIQMRQLNNNKPYLNYRVNVKRNIYKTFLVKTCIDEDLYMLYINNNNNIEKYNYAYIPDYKTSIFMNKLFRNIRENENLDYIEESEDEDIFENICADKYVDLNKKIKMKCVYVHKMKLWKPLEISSDNIAEKKNILFTEKK